MCWRVCGSQTNGIQEHLSEQVSPFPHVEQILSTAVSLEVINLGVIPTPAEIAHAIKQLALDIESTVIIDVDPDSDSDMETDYSATDDEDVAEDESISDGEESFSERTMTERTNEDSFGSEEAESLLGGTLERCFAASVNASSPGASYFKVRYRFIWCRPVCLLGVGFQPVLRYSVANI